jgi:hypothetical protein
LESDGPDNQATFDSTGIPSVDITAPASINAIIFAPTAQSYFIINTGTYNVNGIGTQGIVNNSGATQIFLNRAR